MQAEQEVWSTWTFNLSMENKKLDLDFESDSGT